MAQIKSRIWKIDEFREFLATIKEGQVAHWQDIAEIVGVSVDTITAWKKTPEAQNAITVGIARTLEQMENSGKKDWRMWEAKLKMLGINPSSKAEVKLSGGTDPIELILRESGLREDIKKGSDDRKNNEPIQGSSQSQT